MTHQMNEIQTGDSFEELSNLPAESVHCVMTSPPYWNLRDYDHADQLGLEETPEEFVANLADVFDEVKRVLRPDGSLWLNLGDTYHNKDLQQIPARVALALQSRGWILRNRVTWAKPNPMPHGVSDRLNTTTEPIFHFTKNKEYYYNLEKIRGELAESTKKKLDGRLDERDKIPSSLGNSNRKDRKGGGGNVDGTLATNPDGKNPGDVFDIPTEHFSEGHFAVYPPELCEKPIKATCPKDGIVLDPFAGAGTTCLKAKELGRKFIGIELNPEYADMARARIGLSPHDPSVVRGSDEQTGMEEWQ